MTFDPNKVVSGNWATYVPMRSPKFKIHNTLGLATSALKVQSYYVSEPYGHQIAEGCILYERVDEQWVERQYESFYAHGQKGLKINEK